MQKADRSDDLEKAIDVISGLNADILVLSGVDYDANGLALAALNRALKLPYPFTLSLRPNYGLPSEIDFDGDGKLGTPNDAYAFGRFPGEGAMAILTRFPFDETAAKNYTALLWRDVFPKNTAQLPAKVQELMRLSSGGHYETRIIMPWGGGLILRSWHAAPPAFGEINLRRNHDETAFWLRRIEARGAEIDPFILIGQANIDPKKGSGDKAAIRALLAHEKLHDVELGDTADYGGEIGALRVAYILPSRRFEVLAQGRGDKPQGHRYWPIWVEIKQP